MKGILFKPDMIKAIAEGRKTVTRRRIDIDPLGWELSGFNEGGLLDFGVVHFWRKDYNSQGLTLKPKYKVGEVVYIKEAHRYIQNDGDPYDFGIQYKLDSQVKWWRDNGNLMDYPINEKWRSPLFLKEIFARYFLKIVGVKAGRVQEIAWYDIPKEGIQDDTWSIGRNRFVKKTPERLISDFKHLWDSINKDYPFESNPWDFRYEFELTPSVEIS